MELIDKKKVLDLLGTFSTEEKSSPLMRKLYGWIDILPPEENVARIIRCKDCKFRSYHVDRRYGRNELYMRCMLKDETIGNENGYCHYAEDFDGNSK